MLNPSGIETTQYSYLSELLSAQAGREFEPQHAFIYRLGDDEAVRRHLAGMRRERLLRLEVYRCQTAYMLGHRQLRSIAQQ